MFTIRKYKPRDREQLRYIAKETAWESYKKNEGMLETVPVLYNDYFTKYESDNIFVAVDEKDIPVGYVICSTDFEQFVRMNKEEFLPQVRKLHRPAVMQFYSIASIIKKIKYSQKIHLHIDLLPQAQHQGLGTQLLDVLSDHLYKNGYKYMAVCGVSKNAGSYIFYKKYGFQIYRNHCKTACRKV